MRLSVAAALCCLCTLSFAAEPAKASIRKDTNIPAESLGAALQTLATTYDFQVLYRTEIVQDLKTKGASGSLSPKEALGQVLNGTGLSFKYLDDKTVTVFPIGSTDSAGSGNAPAASSHAASDSAQEGKKSNSETFRLAQARQGQTSSDLSVMRSNQPSEGLAEIIVTAEKRSENLMNVPASLTVLSGASLQAQGVVNFSDYMTLVPSLSDFSAGAEGHGAVILRGLNTGYYQFSNTVGYYIDDVPFSATSPLSYGAYLTLDPDLADIDHLEVLKGPQATLYGASTLGGLIKVVTKHPDLNSDGGEIRFDGSTIDGGGSGYGMSSVANAVLIPGQLAVRISGFDRETPGYMRNVTLGTDDQNVSRKKGGKIAIRWSPNEDVDVDVSAFLQSLFVTGWNNEFVNLKTLAPLTGPYTYSLNFDPTFHTTYEVYNATINYRLASVGTVTNSTSYAIYSDHEQVDYSQYYGTYYNGGPPPAGTAQPLIYSPSLNKFSDELRFTSQRLGGFEWIAGLFFTKEQIGFTDYFFNTIPPSLQPIPGPLGIVATIDNPASYKEEAGFANVTYYFTDAVDLTLGGRYSHNQQYVSYCSTYFSPTATCRANSSSDSDFTYLAALSWRPTSDLNTYARIATSYRPGGPQQNLVPGYPTSFKPDSLTNYEVGVKGAWLDNRLRATFAVYDMNWKDVQMSSNIAGLSVISNGGKATVKGIELETQFVPMARLTLGATVAYTDAKLDSVSAGVSAVTGAVGGDKLPFTPTWAASAVADYVLPLSGTFSSSFGATYRYQGSKWSDYPGNPLNTGVLIPHYQTVDIRAGLAWSRYQLQARVANLLNEHGLDTVVDQRVSDNPPAWAAIIRPRTYVLSLAAKF